MADGLLGKVYHIKNLEAAWRAIRENARSSTSDDVKREIQVFEDDAGTNLRSLHQKLWRGSYKFPPAKGLPIPKKDAAGKKTGKIRPIVLAPVESRIVQRAVLNVLVEIPGLKAYLDTPFSFGGIKKERKAGQSRRDAPSAVPGAIQAVLKGIEQGASYYAAADIR